MERAPLRRTVGRAARGLHRRLGDAVTPAHETVPVGATFPVSQLPAERIVESGQ